ncbi:serine/threonine-protein kinase [Streptomyces echinatus]|uniref:serine/threonine-protein kinase n=1 Tax=Streptomyces echinatus TaxID=67293 RepID=UPI003815217F
MRLRRPTSELTRSSSEVLAGRYRLDGVIGSGGAGDVHRGFDLRLKRPVAVKLFRAGAEIGTEKSFHNEAMILARLQHPGLVTVHDAGRHNGLPYLVMELIDGPTLKNRIHTCPLSPGDTAALGADLAQALAHAHEAGIVHRDVKPSNIILDMSGRPHLTDFGISRLLDVTTLTATGTLVGTAAYLSPEQVLGQSVGPSADTYALGLVLLECITGRLEYDGGPLEAAIARLHRPPELPSSLPQGIAALLREMTALEASARPSAADCARTLTALADPSGCQAVSSMAGVTNPLEAEVPGQAELTHPRSSRTARTAPSKAATTPVRLLVISGAATLAAAMAGALGVSDGSPHQGGGHKATRAFATSPALKEDSRGTPAARKAAATSATRNASAGRLGDTPPRQRSGASSDAPSQESAVGTTARDATPPRSRSIAAHTPHGRITGKSDPQTRALPNTHTFNEEPGKSMNPQKPQKRTQKKHKEQHPR